MTREILTQLCRCPRSGEALNWTPEGNLVSDAGHLYPVRGGVASFLSELKGEQAATKRFYDTFGWAPDEDGALGDTKAFVDTREAPRAYARGSMRRLGERYFSGGGRFILDAGSGPLIDEEVVRFGDRFDHFICTDLSTRALNAAREKLGDRGVYLKSDITNLPIEDDVVDAITCNHVIYQLPMNMQAAAFRELWRVLKPGGVAVIVYWWSDAKLPWRLERLARMLPMRGPGEPGTDVELPELPHNTRPRSWFEAKSWPFAYKYDVFRTVPELFTRTYIPDDWRGRAFLSALQTMQAVAPGYCGKHGHMPAIVIRKPKQPSGPLARLTSKVMAGGVLEIVEPATAVLAL